MRSLMCLFLAGVLLPVLPLSAADTPDAAAIVEAGFEYYRGQASKADVEMVIHRPDWERRMRMTAWTKGTDRSLIRITEPARDEGNGTLKKGGEMWTFNPKVNRVIKLPPAMMAQSWMGSDFSNNDLAKSDSILTDYTHRLIGIESHQEHKVYVIESVPRPAAPVVWGKQVLKVREDYILLEETFFDEDMEPVKQMTARAIQMLGDRLFPRIWRMQKVDQDEEYTQLLYHELAFLNDLPERLFTLHALKSYRE